MTERWLPITGTEYLVSDKGRVQHTRRNAPILLGCLDRYGYQTVALHGRRHKAHRLVCEAFHGPRPEGCEVAHLNGNRADNRAENLAWVTHQENMQQAVAHGTVCPPRPPKSAMPRGSKNTSARLTEDDVIRILGRSQLGESGRALAREYGITSANMSKIIRRERWAHVDPEGNAPRKAIATISPPARQSR